MTIYRSSHKLSFADTGMTDEGLVDVLKKVGDYLNKHKENENKTLLLNLSDNLFTDNVLTLFQDFFSKYASVVEDWHITITLHRCVLISESIGQALNHLSEQITVSMHRPPSYIERKLNDCLQPFYTFRLLNDYFNDSTLPTLAAFFEFKKPFAIDLLNQPISAHGLNEFRNIIHEQREPWSMERFIIGHTKADDQFITSLCSLFDVMGQIGSLHVKIPLASPEGMHQLVKSIHDNFAESLNFLTIETPWASLTNALEIQIAGFAKLITLDISKCEVDESIIPILINISPQLINVNLSNARLILDDFNDEVQSSTFNLKKLIISKGTISSPRTMTHLLSNSDNSLGLAHVDLRNWLTLDRNNSPLGDIAHSLIELDISSCHLIDHMEPLLTILERLTHIIHLKISNNFLADSVLEILDFLPEIDQMNMDSTIEMSRVSQAKYPINFLAFISQIAESRFANVSANANYFFFYEDLAPVSDEPLRNPFCPVSLSLQHCHLNIHHLTHLFHHFSMDNLHTINLSNNRLDDKSANAIVVAFTATAHLLKKLDLDDNEISDRGAQRLSIIYQNNPKLPIRLTRNNIHAIGLSALYGLRKHFYHQKNPVMNACNADPDDQTSLLQPIARQIGSNDNSHVTVSIDLSYCGLKIDDVKDLCDALRNNRSIESLNLSFNVLDKHSFEIIFSMLAHNYRLTSLKLNGNRYDKKHYEDRLKSELMVNKIINSGQPWQPEFAEKLAKIDHEASSRYVNKLMTMLSESDETAETESTRIKISSFCQSTNNLQAGADFYLATWDGNNEQWLANKPSTVTLEMLLLTALTTKNYPLAECLLANGANYIKRTPSGISALQYAETKGDQQAIELLKQYSPLIPLIMQICLDGQYYLSSDQCVETKIEYLVQLRNLLSEGYSPNIIMHNDGQTPLHWVFNAITALPSALHRERNSFFYNVIGLLIYFNADQYLKDKSGRIAFHHLFDDVETYPGIHQRRVIRRLRDFVAYTIDRLGIINNHPALVLMLAVRYRAKQIIHDQENAHDKLNNWLQQLCSIPAFEPILRIAATMVNAQSPINGKQCHHNIVTKGNLLIFIDTMQQTVSGMSVNEGNNAVGMACAHSVFLATGRDEYTSYDPFTRNYNEYRCRGTLLHELTHFVATTIYNNNALPYRDTDVVTLDFYEELYYLVEKLVNECNEHVGINSLDNLRLFHTYFSPIQESYDETKYHSELIARIFQYRSMEDICIRPQTLSTPSNNRPSQSEIDEIYSLAPLQEQLSEIDERFEIAIKHFLDRCRSYTEELAQTCLECTQESSVNDTANQSDQSEVAYTLDEALLMINQKVDVFYSTEMSPSAPGSAPMTDAVTDDTLAMTQDCQEDMTKTVSS